MDKRLSANMSMKNVLKDKCYDGSRIDDKFTVTGRDGYQIFTIEGWAYSGVYDLYNAKGELLFGGFRQFLRHSGTDPLCFRLYHLGCFRQ